MSEVNALKTLRETTLAYLSQSDYENIIKAVEVGGIQSLTGTASMIVKSAVLKHGAHDQSSHNPKKGGGGGGSGGGGSGSSGLSDAKKDLDSLSSSLDKKRQTISAGSNTVEYKRKLGNGQTQTFEASKKEALAALDKSQAKINEVSSKISSGTKLTPNKDVFSQTDYERFEKIGILNQVSPIAQRIFDSVSTVDPERGNIL